MFNMDELHEIGTPVDRNDHRYRRLETKLQRDPRRTMLGEVRKRAHGLLSAVTEEETIHLGLPADTGAVLWWTDGDRDDASEGISLLDTETATELASHSTAAIIEQIIEHYRADPRPDGHPAFALYERRTAAPMAALGRVA